MAIRKKIGGGWGWCGGWLCVTNSIVDIGSFGRKTFSIFRFVTSPLENKKTKLLPLKILQNCVTPLGNFKVKNQQDP